MNTLYYKFYGIPTPAVVEVPLCDVVECADSSRAILQAVYSFDPVTKLPTGDIMCYMASNTPSELKEYILDNLMIDTSSQALPKLPDGIDDETAFALERKLNESADSYRLRVDQYMRSQIELREMAVENAKRQLSSKEPEE